MAVPGDDAKDGNRRPADDTRAALIANARALFAERGYTGTATQELVAEVGLTRGTLHYHFADKLDLFRTVFTVLAGELAEAMLDAAMKAGTGAAALRAACHARLDACLDPAVQRIVLLDGPSVLGWEEWRRVDGRYGMRVLRECVEAAMDEGTIPRQPPAPLALLLSGALTEGALEIATAADRRAARRSVGRAFDTLLDGLRRLVH